MADSPGTNQVQPALSVKRRRRTDDGGRTRKALDLTSPQVIEFRRRLDIYMTEFHREHGLINNRLSWFVTSQSFLIAAWVNVITHDFKPLTPVACYAIPVLGCAVSYFTMAGVNAALSVQSALINLKNKLETEFRSASNPSEEQLKVILEPWGIRTLAKEPILGMLPPKFIPILFLIFWVLVIVDHFMNLLGALKAVTQLL